MATLCPSTSDILANYTSFYNWLQSPSRSSCTNVTNSDVYDALRSARGNPGTTIAQLNSEIKTMKAELENTRAQADITKRRAEMNVRPELTANYYDGWFPLLRPMKRASVTALIAVSVFLLMISLFLLLSVFGVQSAFAFTVPELKNKGSNFKIYAVFIVIIIILIGILVQNYRK